MPDPESTPDVVDIAKALAAGLEARGRDYALGGAIALSFWGSPRGTLDVDLTLFLSDEDPREAVQLMRDLGCVVDEAEALRQIGEHSFLRATHGVFRVDLFLPNIPFYEVARQRRQRVNLEGQSVMIWSAETLAVFKMLFFREKDFVDIRQILKSQGGGFDREWVRLQLVEICGPRDLRVSRWDEITREVHD